MIETHKGYKNGGVAFLSIRAGWWLLIWWKWTFGWYSQEASNDSLRLLSDNQFEQPFMFDRQFKCDLATKMTCRLLNWWRFNTKSVSSAHKHMNDTKAPTTVTHLPAVAKMRMTSALVPSKMGPSIRTPNSPLLNKYWTQFCSSLYSTNHSCLVANPRFCASGQEC